MATSSELTTRLRRWGAGALVAVVVVICLPLVLTIVAGYGVYAVSLHMLIWIRWSRAGTRVLFVYSNSPVWQSYIENNIVPRLPPKSVVLNWSERRTWPRCSLAVAVFRFFGGRREFNPLAVVVEPFCWGRTFRFWQAFRDAKHGNHTALNRVETEFFTYLASRDAAI